MTDTIVKIMVEVLGILAIATNEVKQKRPSQLLSNDRQLLADVH